MVNDADVASTKVLLRKAKGGDADAWRQLFECYQHRWLNKYHADLGTTIRKLYDTEDLVQSAIGDAMRDISKLKNESAFFTWVTSIIRHKMAKTHRRLKRERALKEPGHWGGVEPEDLGAPPDERLSTLDVHLRTLEAILELFPRHPEAMTAVVMKFQEGLEVAEIVKRTGRPRRTVYRWLLDGTNLLKRHLGV